MAKITRRTSVPERYRRRDIVDVSESTTLRDAMALAFRQRRVIAGTFVGVFSLALLGTLVMPKKYVAEMKILVRHQPGASAVSSDGGGVITWQAPVSEEELHSEAELIRSRDVLRTVVKACDLKESGGHIWTKNTESDDQKIARGIVTLEKDLSVEPIKSTNLIKISYKSTEPALAVRVLNNLTTMYLEKHLEMDRAPEQFEFFHERAEEYRNALADAEQRLINFGREQGVVNPGLEKEMSLRKLAEFDADARVARASSVETRQRIHALESQLATLPQRETREIRTSDNVELMQTLKSKLLDLELKRTTLLSQFKDTDRPVQEVQEQINQARAAIEEAEKAPLHDEITDRDPAYEALRIELAKARTDLVATEARAAAISALIKAYRVESEQLDRKEFLHQDMLRAAKADEENYLLYRRKEEEARITDALDRQRFSNVIVAEPAAVPFNPPVRRLLVVMLGGLVAGLVAVLTGFLADRWDTSFRTPKELETFFGSPVVAALPKSSD